MIAIAIAGRLGTRARNPATYLPYVAELDGLLLGVLPVSEKKPTPVFRPVAPGLCPVCGKPSYSKSGEHPQCSLNRADIALKLKSKQRKRA